MIVKLLLFAVLAAPIVVMNLRLVRSIERSRVRTVVVKITADTTRFAAAMREAGRAVAGLGFSATVAAAATRQLGRVVQLQLDEQTAALHLVAVAGIGWGYSDHLVDEVDRRTELFANHYRDWPVEVPMTPRAAALRSVTEDVVMGRLCP